MSEKKRFLLRIDSEVYDALERWSAGELRSVNSEIEYLLREALVRAGRLGPAAGTSAEGARLAGAPPGRSTIEDT